MAHRLAEITRHFLSNLTGFYPVTVPISRFPQPPKHPDPQPKLLDPGTNPGEHLLIARSTVNIFSLLRGRLALV